MASSVLATNTLARDPVTISTEYVGHMHGRKICLAPDCASKLLVWQRNLLNHVEKALEEVGIDATRYDILTTKGFVPFHAFKNALHRQ